MTQPTSQAPPQQAPAWYGVITTLWIVFVFVYFLLRALDHVRIVSLPWFGH
jgi:hypothetical protein